MPPTSPAALKQPALAALTDLLKTSTAAANNPNNTKAAQDTAYAVLSSTTDQIRALNLAVITANTIALQAAGAAMTPGMTQLKDLQTKIGALGKDLTEGASILTKIGSAVTELSAIGLTWF